MKLLALLESDQAGEVLAAAGKIQSLLRETGESWDDLLVIAPTRRWTQAFEFSTQYFIELKRRLVAERNAEHWQAIARAHQDELRRLKQNAAAPSRSEPPSESALKPEAAPRAASRSNQAPGTGQPLIDALIDDAALSVTEKARVEAIATWYRKTGSITRAEQSDLEIFARNAAARRHTQTTP